MDNKIQRAKKTLFGLYNRKNQFQRLLKIEVV